MQTSGTNLLSNADFIGALVREVDAIELVTSNKQETFLNIPGAFDIETSSFYDNDKKCAIMYEWTFGLGYVKDGEFRRLKTYGRTWQQFIVLLDCVSTLFSLNSKRRLVVYVHNLPYEW